MATVTSMHVCLSTSLQMPKLDAQHCYPGHKHSFWLSAALQKQLAAALSHHSQTYAGLLCL